MLHLKMAKNFEMDGKIAWIQIKMLHFLFYWMLISNNIIVVFKERILCGNFWLYGEVFKRKYVKVQRIKVILKFLWTL